MAHPNNLTRVTVTGPTAEPVPAAAKPIPKFIAPAKEFVAPAKKPAATAAPKKEK